MNSRGVFETNITLSAGNHSVEIILHNTSVASIENKIQLIAVLPNPAHDFIFIKMIDRKEKIQLIITHEKGIQVSEKTIQNDLKLDIKNLSAGIYFIEAENSSVKQEIRFVKS